MGPSIFARPAQESPPPRSRLKTLSAFLNPFGSSQLPTSTNQPITFSKTITPSAPIPYHPPKTDISLTDLGHIALGGSPFRVLLQDGNTSSAHDGLPSTGPRRSSFTPPANQQQESVSGLPSSHYPLAALNRDSAQGKPVWKELPTLASAIHIDDEPTAATTSAFVPSQPLPKASSRGTMSRSASSTSSIFESYRNRKTLRRSTSRSSTKVKSGEETDSEEKSGVAVLKRRMSRRLSFDNILHPFSGAPSRRKDKSNDDSAKDDDVAAQEVAGSSAVPKPHRLALPPMRSVRNKFSVGAKGGSTMMANARADVAARRRIHDWEGYSRKDSDIGSDYGSVGSAVGKGVLRRMGEAQNHPLQPAPQTSSAVEPSPTEGLKAQRDLHDRRTSMAVQPSLSPHPISPDQDPAQEATRLAQTPGGPLANLRLPNESRGTLLFSPACDDMSILDPARSPLPYGLSCEDLSSFLPMPIPPPRDPLPEAALVVTAAELPADEQVVETARRQQSLSELKDAFTRMRDISGIDSSTISGSLPSSRCTSERVDTPTETPEDCVSSDMSQKIKSKPSLDLSNLDGGLKAVVDESIRGVELGTPIRDIVTRTIRASGDMLIQDGPPPTSPMKTSTSTTVVNQAKLTEHDDLESDIDGGLSQAQSGRSWHTAEEDSVSLRPTTPRLLPRSKSRSTHDLASLASGRNLVDHMQQTQGEGWWSVDKRTIGRRASEVDSLKRRFNADDDERLQLLEKIAKSSTLPHRPKIADQLDFATGVHAESTPNDSAKEGRETPQKLYNESYKRPNTSLEKHRSRADIPRTSYVERTRHGSVSVAEWRPATVLPRVRPTYHGPRPSLVAGSTWGRDSRSSLVVEEIDTPTKPSSSKGPFANSRISPDIARRASCLTNRVDIETDKEAGSSQTKTKSAMEDMAERHALELDAILGALGRSKKEVKGLQGEVVDLKKELSDTIVEREVLKEKVKSFEARLVELENRSRNRSDSHNTRGRSSSVASSLLPDLAVPEESLVIDASPLYPPLAPISPEETTLRRGKRTSGISQLADSSLMSACVTEESSMEEDDEEAWTLKLRRDDERHLDDL